MKEFLCKTVYSVTALTLLSALLLSCDGGSRQEAADAADSFAVAYFNWRFFAAVPYSTPESKTWLNYAASQVTQEDIDSLKAKAEGAKITIEDIDMDDSTALVTVKVRDYIPFDSIGGTPHTAQEATFKLSMALREETWKVELNGLPRAKRK